MSIYSFGENAATATSVGDTDFFPVNQAGVLKQIPASTMNTMQGGTINATAGATVLAVTQLTHSNRLITLSNTAPIAVTLPTATGSGAKYTFVINAAATTTASTIKVGNATDVMTGVSWVLTTASANVVGYGTTATDDTISINGTTLGGVVGDIIEINDAKAALYSVKIMCRATGTTATPFSATV